MAPLSTDIDWTTFKAFVDVRFLSIQYVDISGKYWMKAIDGYFELECVLDKVNQPNETADFEANYKAKGNASFSDADGAPIARLKASKKGYVYIAMPFEMSTARLRSGNTSAVDDFYSKDAGGNDRTWITCKIYDANDVEITTPGALGANYNNAVKTVLDFEPPFDYEVIGGSIRTTSTIGADLRVWVVAVPDVPANMGGSKEMASGINLNYLAANAEYAVDGRVTKFLSYNATYHTNKLRFIFKYPAGTNTRIALNVEMYKA